MIELIIINWRLIDNHQGLLLVCCFFFSQACAIVAHQKIKTTQKKKPSKIFEQNERSDRKRRANWLERIKGMKKQLVKNVEQFNFDSFIHGFDWLTVILDYQLELFLKVFYNLNRNKVQQQEINTVFFLSMK